MTRQNSNLTTLPSTRIDLQRADSHHENKALDAVGMHYASATESARRRSVEQTALLSRPSSSRTRGGGGAEVSKTPSAQTAWEVSSAAAVMAMSRSGSVRERERERTGDGGHGRRVWRA